MFVGLGDDISATSALDALGIDPGSWDWHEWALVSIAGYLVMRTLYRGGRIAKRAVGRRAKKVRGSVSRRKQALKTVFTG